MLLNRSYIMTENMGYFVIVGSPKTKSTPAIKYMKYAVLMNAHSIRILLIQNTKVALDVNIRKIFINRNLNFFSRLKIVNEEMIKSNGKLLQIPKLFELRNLEKDKVLTLEMVINSTKNMTTIDFSSLWSLKKDFYEIEIPILCNTIALNSMNLNISACLKYENEYLFAYSTHEVVIKQLIFFILNIELFVSSLPQSMNNRNSTVP